MDLVLNNQQRLICPKNQPTNQPSSLFGHALINNKVLFKLAITKVTFYSHRAQHAVTFRHRRKWVFINTATRAICDTRSFLSGV